MKNTLLKNLSIPYLSKYKLLELYSENNLKNIDLEDIRTRYTSYRSISPGLEEILFIETPVLDKGFITAIDYMGNDESITQAARVSYQKGTKTVRNNADLISYLMRNDHQSPIEMCEIKFHIKMPIFVLRQFIRHRTHMMNEQSGRYSILEKDYYIPDPQFISIQSKTNRQGRGDTVSEEQSKAVIDLLTSHSESAYLNYELLLGEDLYDEKDKMNENSKIFKMLVDNDEHYNMNDDSRKYLDFIDTYDTSGNKVDGLARELSRIGLTLNYYTQFFWKMNLRNLLHLLSLRMDSHAQWEIRQYANIMYDICKLWVPQVIESFDNCQLHAIKFTRNQLKILQLFLEKNITDEDLDYEKYKLYIGKGEYTEFINKFKSLINNND